MSESPDDALAKSICWSPFRSASTQPETEDGALYGIGSSGLPTPAANAWNALPAASNSNSRPAANRSIPLDAARMRLYKALNSYYTLRSSDPAPAEVHATLYAFRGSFCETLLNVELIQQKRPAPIHERGDIGQQVLLDQPRIVARFQLVNHLAIADELFR